LSFKEKIRSKNDSFELNKKTVIISLSIISIIGIFVRISFVSFELPITLDGLIYFWYAIDMSQSGNFPSGYPEATNNGWPSFLSIFFSLYNSSNFLDFMEMQRLTSIVLSVLTIIPIYLLCKRFVPNIFAIFGAGLFVFEPRIIQNSILGISEPLLILLSSFSIYLFLRDKMNLTYIAFGLASIAILIRAEAIFIFLVLTVGFFWRYKNRKLDLIKYLFCLGILALVLLPMMNVRIDTIGNDGIFSRFVTAPNTLSENAVKRGIESGNLNQIIILGFENFVKFLGWSMIPSFLVFVPFGYILLLKNRNFKRKFIIFYSVIISIPVIFALSVASDSRYLFPLYPVFCVAAAISLENFSKRINRKKLLMIIVLFLVLVTSIFYLDYKIDLDYERESFELSKIVILETERINLYGPEAKFIPVHKFYEIETFPTINSNSIPIRLIDYGLPLISDFNSIEELMEYLNEHKITHLVLDGTDDPEIISDIFKNENKFIFLEKTYDSTEHGFNQNLKIFKINYEIYQNMNE